MMDSKRAIAFLMVFKDWFYCLPQFFLFPGTWARIVLTMQPGGCFQNGQPLALAEGNGLCLLLRRETAALSGHGVHSRLSRRLSDLSIEPGQPQNLLGPFKGQGYFRLLPQDRPATLEDVRRFALHTTESLKEQLEDPSAVLHPMATHRQGLRQKREVM
jgi:hypothetical protein